MTRKRFVKLLMSGGFSRNEANFIAWGLPKGHSYHALFLIPDIFVPVCFARYKQELIHGAGLPPVGMVPKADTEEGKENDDM